MDALVVLAAVVVGWLLGFGQQAWRDRHAGQLATRLLVHEDAFVNYCINAGRTIRSQGGRLYCETRGRYSARMTKLR